MQRYEFAEQARVSGVSAQAVGERLEHLQDTHEVLTPKLVVEDARPEEAVLHPAFEWDDATAAELHREWQARSLIKSVRIVQCEDVECAPRRAYLNVTVGESRGYVNSVQVMSDDLLREQVLEKAKADLRSWRERYKDLQELAGLFAVVDEIVSGSPIQTVPLAAKP